MAQGSRCVSNNARIVLSLGDMEWRTCIEACQLQCTRCKAAVEQRNGRREAPGRSLLDSLANT